MAGKPQTTSPEDEPASQQRGERGATKDYFRFFVACLLRTIVTATSVPSFLPSFLCCVVVLLLPLTQLQ